MQNADTRQQYLHTVALVILAWICSLALASCGSASSTPPLSTTGMHGTLTPLPPVQPTTSKEQDSAPDGVPPTFTLSPLPSPAATAAAATEPQIDVIHARVILAPSRQAPLSADPFLGDLSFQASGGQQVSASEILSATVLETKGQDVQRARWLLAAADTTGTPLSVIAEQVGAGTLSVVVTSTQPSRVASMSVCLPGEPDEKFYGLGERFGHLNLAGHVIGNRTADEAGLRSSYAPATFLLSSRGYGLYLKTMGYATFDLRIAERGCYQVTAADAELNLTFFAGPHPQAVIERHARWIGLPPLPPEWSFGVWKNLIGGQERVLQDLQKLRDAGVPLDALWIYDAVVERAGFGWPWQIYGPIAPGSYSDLPGLIAQLHGQDLKVLGYLNPFIYPGWEGYDKARQQGYLVQTKNGQPYLQQWTFGQRAYLDFTSPEATRWWRERVSYALGEVGFDGAMLDFGEDAPADGVYAGLRASYLMDDLYPVLYHRAAYEAGQATKPNAFAFLARAGYSGSQRYNTGRFTGDQVRSWSPSQGLPSVLPAVLNGSISGWPYWGPDIAGFFPADPPLSRADEKEIWIRWLELGAVMPTMRDMNGAMDNPVGLWTDKDTLSAYRAYAELHAALKPYIYHYAGIAHARGLPIVRALFLNYPDEAEAYLLADEYLLGDDLLVAPVVAQGQRERSVHLPSGRWRNYWTGEVSAGPGHVTVPAPLQQIPLFIRSDGNLDLAPITFK
jgi:alpha-glucosidase (family GH31 glycosyl hydrolase)